MFSLNESLAFLLNRTGAAIAGTIAAELKAHGLTLPMWRALAALSVSGEQSLGGLAEITSVEISTLSRQVATLTDRGLVSRRQSGLNWRSINLRLTIAGHELVDKLLPIATRHETAALTGMSAADIRRLKTLLNLIYANLTKAP